jgi:hypothetical protein
MKLKRRTLGIAAIATVVFGFGWAAHSSDIHRDRPISQRRPDVLKSQRIRAGVAGPNRNSVVRASAPSAPSSSWRTVQSSAGTHPFLLVRREDYPVLQDRASQSPWKEIKAQAIAEANTLVYRTMDDYWTRSATMQYIVGSAALAYILDPANRAAYAKKVYETLLFWDDLYDKLNRWEWTYYVRPGSAFFESVLALDIVYDDLTVMERETIEGKLSKVAEWYWSTTPTFTGWPPSAFAVRGVWALYQGDRPRIDASKASYRSGLMNLIAASGVFYEGPGYGIARLSWTDRVQKWAFIDVLEFTGEDRTYYSDPQLRAAYEWLYRAAANPVRYLNVFADTYEFINVGAEIKPATLRARRFSDQAARHAAWHDRGGVVKEKLLAYLLMDQPLPVPEKPVSKIWTDNAVFWENHPSDHSLMGALWNATRQGSHNHRDVNTIHLTAYGESLLSNAGWALSGAFGYPVEYFKEMAVAGNTVLLDGVNHAKKIGMGVVEGFTAPVFDYASGDSGAALPNGTHVRNFVLVHPQDRKNGYFVLFDEASRATANSATTVNIALHPPSATYNTVLGNQEYRWAVQRLGTEQVSLSIFLGTAPSTVEIRDGPLSIIRGGIFKYLYSTYGLEGPGRRSVVTVLFPHDAMHAKATMSRIIGVGYSGASINLGGGVKDIALASAVTRNVRSGRVSFRGHATLYRQNGRSVTFLFVRKGRVFNDGATQRRGFDADADVSVYLKGTTGRIISPRTDVTFYHPRITGVKLNGTTAPSLVTGAGWVKITVPPGTHDVELTIRSTSSSKG